MSNLPGNPVTTLVTTDSPGVKAIDNKTGQDVLKSGQTVQATLIEAIMAAYTTLTQQPIALSILMFAVLIGVAEINDTNGPLEHLLDKIQAILKEENPVGWKLSLLQNLVKVFEFLVSHKFDFIAIVLFMVPAIARPSTKNMILAPALGIFVILMRMNVADTLIASQFWFVFTRVRNPNYKFLTFLIAMLYFGAHQAIFGTTVGSSTGSNNGTKVTTEVPVTTTPAASDISQKPRNFRSL